MLLVLLLTGGARKCLVLSAFFLGKSNEMLDFVDKTGYFPDFWQFMLKAKLFRIGAEIWLGLGRVLTAASRLLHRLLL